jgi:hypothetical protein
VLTAEKTLHQMCFRFSVVLFTKYSRNYCFGVFKLAEKPRGDYVMCLPAWEHKGPDVSAVFTQKALQLVHGQLYVVNNAIHLINEQFHTLEE